MKLLTNQQVEDRVIKRIQNKATAYGQVAPLPSIFVAWGSGDCMGV